MAAIFVLAVLRRLRLYALALGLLVSPAWAQMMPLSPGQVATGFAERQQDAQRLTTEQGELQRDNGRFTGRLGARTLSGQGLTSPDPLGVDANDMGAQEPDFEAREALPEREPNGFQVFVQQVTGNLLPLFGSEFFNASNVFVNRAAPVADDYRLAPGDEVLVRIWGAVEAETRARLDRDGTVTIPTVGPVSLAGVRVAEAPGVVEQAVGRYYRDFRVSVTPGLLHGITVYVVGQALQPGTYSLPGTSTLVTALLQSGGPGPNGSLRTVQLRRANKVVAELDLYEFLTKGDTSGDVRLIDGDVIVIPPAAGYVALTGEVKTQAVFELKGQGDTLASVIEAAGGVAVVADPRRAFVERMDAGRERPRSVAELALDDSGLAYMLQPGDLVSIRPIVPEFDNAVTLRGGVNPVERVPYRDGMRVTDLIPDRAYLINRHVVTKQNESLLGVMQRHAADDVKERESASTDFVNSVGNLFVDINWDYAVVERLQRPDMSLKLLPFNLGQALADPNGADNLQLMPGDTVSVFTADDVRVPVSRRRTVVRVEGEVKRPGVYLVEAGETLVNILERAGGPTSDAYLFGAEFYRESVRKSQQANLDKLVRRLEQQMVSDSATLSANVTGDAQALQAAQLQLQAQKEARERFVARLRTLKSTGRLSLGLSGIDASIAQIPSFRLENGDRMVVPPRPDFVQVFGAVNTETALLWRHGRTVSDYLVQAGMSREADLSAAFVLRADGTVISNANRMFSSVQGTTVLPGDIIVVPESVDRESGWVTFTRFAKDWTQILSNLGLGAAAIKTLRD